MSWKNQNDFDAHGGRNAFRNAPDSYKSSTERAATLRGMLSFTESIECDLPPDIASDSIGMKSSDTNDTIIEVMKPSSSSVDPSLGETQKYKMAVPGPGHSEQEHEMHKSLIRDEDDEIDQEIEHAMAPKKRPSEPPSAFSRHLQQDPDHAALRREYSNSAVQRPRATTPTSACAIETFAFIGGEGGEIEEEKKIKVSIPEKNNRRRKSDMPYSEFYDNMSSQMPYQTRGGTSSGRTTPMNDYEGDILEENPAYRNKAPPKPVIHRRSSRDWENFEEMKDRMATNPSSSQSADPPQLEDDDEEPSFSEDMIEERKKAKHSRHTSAVDKDDPIKDKEEEMTTTNDVFPTFTRVDSIAIRRDDEDDETHEEDPDDVFSSFKTEESINEKKKDELEPKKKELVEDKTMEEVASQIVEVDEEVKQDIPEVVPAAQEESTVLDPFGAPSSFGANDITVEESTIQSDPLVTDETSAVQNETAEQSYDPNAYPGYIWNYDIQQWEVDPNYVAPEETTHTSQQDVNYPEGYDYSNYNGQNYYSNYDATTGEYNSYQQYDQNQANYDTTGYNQYDQSATGYDQAQTSYDQTTVGYDQTTGRYEQSGYDQTTYDQQVPNYDYSQYDQTGYDENNGYDGSNYYHTQGYDQTTTAYDQNTTGYDQTTNYDQITTTNDQTTTEYNQQQYGYDANTQYDHNQQSYVEGSYDQGYAAESSYTQPSTVPSQPPPRPFAPDPLFNRPPPPNPYDWDAPSSEPTTSTTVETVSSPPPARPAPPSRPAPPQQQNEEQQATTQAPPPRPPPAARPPPPRPGAPKPKAPEPEPEEDAWTQFKKMTDKMSVDVKTTEEKLKDLSTTSAADEIKDESYLAGIGGGQGYIHTGAQKEILRLAEEKKNEKILKKKLKQQGKKAASPTFDPEEEDNMDRKAQELAMKMAAMRSDLGDWKPPTSTEKDIERKDSLNAIPPRKRSSLKDVQQDSGGSLELPAHLSSQQRDSITPKGDFAPDDPKLTAKAWADFDSTIPDLPPSQSGFFSTNNGAHEVDEEEETDPFAPPPKFTPAENLIDDNYDPFAVRPVEDIMAAAKAKAEEARLAKEVQEDMDFFGGSRHSPTLSTPTPEGGSPLSSRPTGFEDDFKCEGMDLDTPTPLYDEDDSEPLTEFSPKFIGDGWELMIRHPIKKKSFMAERYWKPCFARLNGNTLFVFNSKTDSKPISELLLRASYSLSDTTLQAYDVYGKIHTVKLQYVQYKEKVGIRPGQISRLVDGHITKYGLPLEHSAQATVLLKFGSLVAGDLQSFVSTIEDVLFKCPAKRDTKPIYKQDEVQVHCYDEYSAYVDKDGLLSDQKARVRLFCLAFVTGSPFLEIGLNDRRRQGKEIVRRKDILPMYTERWIRFENLEFHNTVDEEEFNREQVIKISPPDGCFFEMMRFRIRPPRNREKALTTKCIMKIAGSKVEIRLEVMAAAQVEKSKGGRSTKRQVPCEDIAIRFPIPEAWIYIFREERHWGVGSVHSKKLRPGKVKNLKDRLLGAVQSHEPNLIECAIGEAKYEHVYRSLVWRIPRLPEKHHAAYKSHLLKCRFELSSFDLMPETFLPRCDVDFTMPLATVSNTVVRSVSVEQHEDSDRVEKFVRYVAKCQYKVEIDYVQCANLDVDTMDPSINPDEAMSEIPEMHQPTFHPTQVAQIHDSYRIDFNESETGGAPRPRNDSSSDDEDDNRKVPIIQIDMKNYGY